MKRNTGCGGAEKRALADFTTKPETKEPMNILRPFRIFRRFAAALVILSLVLAGCATTQSRSPSVPGVEPPAALAEEVRQARALLSLLAEQAVGLSVAVARDGQILWSEAYGHRELETGQAATPNTVFRLYSVSKPMTAVAAARLVERGRLDGDAPVQRYVPAFPDKGTPITPMQLATHTSGIRHYTSEAEARSRRHCSSVAEAVQIFAEDPLVHPPGTEETYSSWGYVLLSAVLEGATGETYERAMADLLFQPLGLHSLLIDDPGNRVATRASFYRKTAPGIFAAAEEVDNTCKWGAGAWLATAEDVAYFGLALINESLLQPQTRQLFLRGQSVYRAQGVGAGGAAFLVVDGERKLSIALLSNAIGETLGPALQSGVNQLHEIFGGEPSGR
jgi:CubicO group peptidase (beta-lactamase class C family)